MSHIKTLKELGKNDTHIAGGKGASLGEMTSAGIPVPPGYVVLSCAFDRFVEETGWIEIDAILDKVVFEEMHTIENASEEIQALIMGAEMPSDLTSEITSHFQALGAKFVAVRSSATSEDSSTAAWAGQLDSFLNTTGETLLENVKKCWASLFTPRAIFYRKEKNLHNQKISVAVVVQKMVESFASGIAFSVHPVTQSENQAIIEAGFGLGEAIVSGQITPDSYVVEKEPRRIIDKNVHVQSRGLYRKAEGGNEWRTLPETEGGRQVLSDSEIMELTELVIRIERHYGFPCDIEWAREKARFYIVQSRPITTLSNKPANNTETRLTIKDFILEFEAEGLKPLFQELMFKNYYPPYSLMTFKDNVLRSLIHKKTWVEMGQKGLELMSDEKNRTFENAISDIKRVKSDFKIGGELTEHTLRNLLSGLKSAARSYGYFNMAYLEESHKHLGVNPTLDQSLRKVEQLKDKIKEDFNQIFFTEGSHWNKLISALSRQFSVEKNQLEFYLEKEVFALFSGNKLSEQEINERKRAYVLKSDNQKEFLQGSEAERFLSEFDKEPIDRDGSIISGTVSNTACGIVKGRVKLISINYEKFDETQIKINEMRKGDILVSRTTDPSLIQACKKASAIITDVGGMLSHAAITARELNIPGIIGTQIATKVLKDGDMVEVDAEKGVVRIIGQEKTQTGPPQNEYFKLGRWVAPVLEYEAWLDWNDTPESRELGVKPDETPVIYLDGNHLEPNQGAFTDLIKQNAKEFAESRFDTATKILSLVEKLSDDCLQESRSIGREAPIRQLEKSFRLMKRLRFPWMACFAISDAADSFLKNYSSRMGIPAEKLNAGIPQLPNPLTTDQRELARLRQEISKRRLVFDHASIKQADRGLAREIEDYQKKTEHISTHHFWGDPRTMERLMEAIKNAQSPEPKQTSPPAALSQLFGIIAKTTKARLDCAQSSAQLAYSFRMALTRLAEKSGIRYEDIVFLTTEEILNLDRTNTLPPVNEISEREKSFGITRTKGQITIFIGKELEQLCSEYGLNQSTRTQEVKGEIGCRGKAIGIAAIVLAPKDHPKVLQGMILIAPETTPDFMPAMSRAAAFVTDRGGVTSHAAIIAREMGKPCIIGTGISTQAFKDGDMVEVDAEKGVVRLISHGPDESIPDFFRSLRRFATRPMTLQRDECVAMVIWHHKARTVIIPVDAQNRAAYIETNDAERAYTDMLDTFRKADKWKKHITSYGSACSKMLKTSRDASKIGGRSDKELLKAYRRWLEVFNDFSPYLFAPFAIEAKADPLCRKLLAEELGKDAESAFATISTPSELNEFQKMRLEMIDAVVSGKNNASKHKELADKYGWYNEYSWVEPLFGPEHFAAEMAKITKEEGIKERDRMKADAENNRKAFAVLMKKPKREETKTLAESIHTYTFLRTDRIEKMKRGQAAIRPLYDAIGRSLGKKTGQEWTRQMVVSCLNQELIDFLEHGTVPDICAIQKRTTQQYIYYVPDGKPLLIEDETLVRQACDIIPQGEAGDGQIKGTIAYGGKATGRVVIVNNKKDLSKVKPGDVLVAKITMPDYTPAMHIACAFVTEEGGVTSHAAIIARELKKPCIVGTGNCTRLLKDGDVVEVDADAGVVRIIGNNPPQTEFISFRKRKIPLFTPLIYYLTPYSEERVGFDLGKGLMVIEDEMQQMLFSKKEFEQAGEYLLKQTIKDPLHLKRRMAEGLKIADDWISFCKTRLVPEKLKECTDQELCNLLSAYLRQYEDYSCVNVPPWMYMGDKLFNHIKSEMNLPEDKLLILTTPNASTYSREFEAMLLDITLACKKKIAAGGSFESTLTDKKISRAIDQLSEKYFWIPFDYLGPETWDRGRIIDELKKNIILTIDEIETKIKIIKEYPVSLLRSQKALIKEHHLTKGQTDLLEAIKDVATLQDDKKSATTQAHYYLGNLMSEISRRSGTQKNLVYLLLASEIKEMLLGKKDFSEELERRKRFCVGEVTSRSVNVYSGQKAHDLLRFHGLKRPSEPDSGEGKNLQGQTGAPGKYTGTAKVLLSPKESTKLNQGDVLVASMTTPDYVPLMKKAGAIVTDEGGITCHAAIVSRELGIPCVIGTKNATQVIKDGDIVEVDADKGTVRMIQSGQPTAHRPFSAKDPGIKLSDQFIKLVGEQELFPPMHNSAIFIQASRWNAEQSFGKYYSDKTPYPILITQKSGQGIMYLPFSKTKKLVCEVFEEYWNDPVSWKKRMDQYRAKSETAKEIYDLLTPSFISKTKFEDLIPSIESIRTAVWELNTLAFFTVYLDKELCITLLKKSRSKLTPERLDTIWETTTTPAGDSFDKRRLLNILDLLDKKKTWAEIAETCQYYEAYYYKVLPLSDAERILKERYGKYSSPSERAAARSDIKKEKDGLKARRDAFLATLTPEEKKLVAYLQAVIELRDDRKDFISMLLTSAYRVAEKLFTDAGVPHDLIFFCLLDEMTLGKEYLLQNRKALEDRLAGCTVLVDYDGKLYIEQGSSDETNKRMESFFLDKEKKHAGDEIRGQAGSSGKSTGCARVIQNIETEGKTFRRGEILVTGMTRPEFVPLMKLAAGIVTDEGGITCHAAIVSRELGIPCVIGTRIASRIIKDGDMVEVDADDGVVRIINSSQSLINKIPTIYETIVATKDWLILNGAEVPYIAGYVLKQFTSGIHRTYPEYPFITLACLHGTKEGSDGQFVLNNKEYRDSAVYLFDHLEALDRLYDDFVKAEEKLTELIQQLQNKDDEYLHTHYDQFLKLYDSEYIAAGPIDGFLVYSDEFLERMKKKYPGKDKQIACLVEPYGNTFLTDHTIGLHEIAITLKKSGKKPASSQELLGDNALRAKIESHKKKFFWIQNNYKDVQPLQIEFFADQAFELSKQELSCLEKNLSDLKRRSVSHQKECQSIEEKGIFEKDDCTKLSWLGKMAWWIDRRKKYNLIGNYLIGRHLGYLCKINDLPYEDAAFLLPEEFDLVISGEKGLKDYPISERKIESLFITDKYGQELFLHGKQCQEIWNQINPPVDTSGIKEIHGVVANKGNIIGVARVIKDPKSTHLFDKGDVLVTGMTRPDFLSLMHKAGAFITDEGGVTCHAAIVARELNKPCVIGTKIATQAIKDGDTLEVDADNGIVRIISRNDTSDKPESRLRSSSFIRMFEATGMPLLTTTIAMEHYKPLGAVAVFRDNIWTAYLPKTSESKTLQQGLEMFSSKTLFTEFKRSFEEYMKSSTKSFNQTLSQKKITLPEAEKFISLISEHWKHYMKTESFFVDEAFNKSKEGKVIAANLGEFENIKTAGRQHLNSIIFGSDSQLSKLISMISKQTGVPATELLSYSKDELLGALTGKRVSKETLRQRAESYAIVDMGEGYTILEGDRAKRFIAGFITEQMSDEIRGTVANKGKAKGRAKVLFYGPDTFDKIPEMLRTMDNGDILVTETTSPEIMSACKKASAILTNQGGMLSHAAIVSRELGIPCIVGLENITHRVKDGDMVEVDADNGVVRILKGITIDLEDAKQLSWKVWLERPYGPFMSTMNYKGVDQKYFEAVGLKGFGYTANLYQYPLLFQSEKLVKSNRSALDSFMKTNTIFDLTKLLERAHDKNLKEIQNINSSKLSPTEKLASLRELACMYFPFLWIIEPLESYYVEKTNSIVPKHIQGDVKKWVGDASMPKKKNAYILMQEALKTDPIERVHKEFAWLKSRDGFTDFYTIKELEEIKDQSKEEHSTEVNIPKPLSGLAEEIKELTYFRTDRTDKYYEFLGLCRQIFMEVASAIGVPFKELANYDVESILAGKPKKIDIPYTFLYYKGRQIVMKERLIEVRSSSTSEVKGLIAFPGIARGIARIVKHPTEASKLNRGEILVAQMTFPSFIAAMQKAAAFVTDEGGITCHAAIIAREMRKPCIVGTGNCTKALKDGDMVEVDADKGIVRVISRNESSDKPESRLRSSSFIRMFEATGMPLLTTSVSMKHYQPLGVVAVFRNNIWTAYLPKTSERKALQQGLEMFSSKTLFTEFKRSFEEYMKSSTKSFNQTLSQKKITLPEAEKFISLISEHWKHYMKTESFFVDEAFNKSKEGKVIAANLGEFENIKTAGRQHLNSIIFGSDSQLSKLISMISKQTGVPATELLSYSKDELLGALTGKRVSKETLRQRAESYAIVDMGEGYTILEGDRAKRFIAGFITEQMSDEIRGTVANKGKATGPAKVLFYGPDTFDKIPGMIQSMEGGSILVTETTSPEIMSACKKASAILTNQGGMLSHAAIVSRELGIPCIVGLENITHRVKDGDMVEVDADKGVVKIIKPSKK